MLMRGMISIMFNANNLDGVIWTTMWYEET